jgi:hypothetical protein
MTIFFEVLKNQKVLGEWALIVFTIFGYNFVKKLNNEVSAYFYEIT